MFWYMAAILDILQKENNKILEGSVIIVSYHIGMTEKWLLSWEAGWLSAWLVRSSMGSNE